jgi:uncharacterized protein (DUF885 family)
MTPTAPRLPRPATPRQVADRYVDAVCELNPLVATSLGTRPGDDRLPDVSPAGLEAEAALTRETLAELDRVLAENSALEDDPIERSCARLLRERLGAELAAHEQGEGLRALSNLFSPVHAVRQVFSLMPAVTEEDWSVIARRMARVPTAYAGFRESLEEGARQGLLVAGRQVRTVVAQLDEWLAGPYFAGFVATGPESLHPDLTKAAQAADQAVADMRDFLRDVYAPQTEGRRTPSAASGTPRPRVAGPAPTSARVRASRRPTRGAGQSTGGFSPSSGSRPRRSCRAPHLDRQGRWRPCAGWAPTGRRSRVWRRSAPGCSR